MDRATYIGFAIFLISDTVSTCTPLETDKLKKMYLHPYKELFQYLDEFYIYVKDGMYIFCTPVLLVLLLILMQ